MRRCVEAVEAAQELLRGEGARLRVVEIPDLAVARAALWVIASVEAADMHRERLERSAADYHPVVRARLERGVALPGTLYVRAQRIRRWLAVRLGEALRGCAALLMPVAPLAAYPLGAREVDVAGRREDVGQAVTRFTPLASLTGRPALSLPCGLVDGLPVGLQLVGHPREEATVLRIARGYERAAGWALHPPVEW